MDNSKVRIPTVGQRTVSEIKRTFLASHLDSIFSSIDLSAYALWYKGKELDEEKQLADLDISNYNFECVLRTKHTIRVFIMNKTQPVEILFYQSISVNDILSKIDGDNGVRSFFLTKRNSSIVLTDDLCTSLDVTCTFLYISYY